MTKYVLIPAHYKKEIKLTDEVFEKLGTAKKVALIGAVQFIKLGTVEKQFEEKGIQIITSHGKRTSGKYQTLGCDCNSDSFSEDIFGQADKILYIGDGLFHPKALVLAQLGRVDSKEVLLFDPINDTVRTIDGSSVDRQRKKYKANILRFMQAQTVGLLVSTKTGQQYLKNAVKFKEKFEQENPNNHAIIFIDDTFNYALMENYPYIDCWVNTACPRIGYDDCADMPKPLVNINDAFDPNKALVRFA